MKRPSRKLFAEQLEIIEAIYDLQLEPQLWGCVLDKVARQGGAQAATLYAVEHAGDRSFFLEKYSPFFTEQAVSEARRLSEKLGSADPFDAVRTKPPGKIVTDEEVWPNRDQYDARPIVTWGREKFGLYHRAAMRLNDEAGWFDMLALQYDQRRAGIQSGERKNLEVLHPHLAKAIEVARAFTKLKMRFNAVLGALDRFRLAIFLALPSGELLHANAAAMALAGAGKGVSIAGSRLIKLADDEATARLGDAIMRMSATANGQNDDAAISFKSSKIGGGEDYLIDVSPLRDTPGELDPQFRGAFISMLDPDDPPPISLNGLAALYGLTSAETKIVHALVLGHSASEIADQRNVTLDTVKSQIKSIYAKTPAGGRADLVRVAMSINLPIDPANAHAV